MNPAREGTLSSADNPERVLGARRERFQDETNVVPQLTVACLAQIESLHLPAGARKRRCFVDLRG
jgi:hypothetical protein